jgi:hypothetical protein
MPDSLFNLLSPFSSERLAAAAALRFRGVAAATLRFVGGVGAAGRERNGQASSSGGLLIPLLSQPPAHHVCEQHRDISGGFNSQAAA